ncbi:MAG TPA: kinase/pyrophosphorylase, partial [Pseudomonadales bacterium]|nr:kinase/pyrophosphorylase [Pseudomonadales bacterium]
MKRTVFFISDGTGITAETMGKSLLSHFETLSFSYKTIPYLTAAMAEEVRLRIDAVHREDGLRPIVIATIIDETLLQSIRCANAFFIDLLSTFLRPLEEELQTPSSHTVGKYHSISQDLNYKIRIDAVNFA